MNNLWTQSARIETLQKTVMIKHTLKELAVIELRDRTADGTFETFCAAKREINDRNYQCAACSLNWHRYSGEAAWLHPCDSCKGKNPIPQISLRA
jgi:hypothetical protein